MLALTPLPKAAAVLLDCDEAARENLISFIGNVHEIVVNGCTEYLASFRRYVYVTPKSYLSFIASYKILYGKKFEFISDQERRVRVGLQKLQQATTDVENMKVDLAKKKKVLIKAEKDAKETAAREAAARKAAEEAAKAAEEAAKKAASEPAQPPAGDVPPPTPAKLGEETP